MSFHSPSSFLQGGALLGFLKVLSYHVNCKQQQYFSHSLDTKLSEQPKSTDGANVKDDAASPSQERSVAAKKDLTLAGEFCSFVDASPSSHHAVQTIKSRLQEQGFNEISERDDWRSRVSPGGKHFVVRNDVSGSSIIAFAVGKRWKAGNPFTVVATHVDSPCLKMKPVSLRSSGGYLQVGVQTYGGGLWHTWFDRDLGIAGRVLLRTGRTSIETSLVNIREPLLRVTSLASHYNSHNPFEFNKETQLLPFAGLETAETKEKFEVPKLEYEDTSSTPKEDSEPPFLPSWRTSDATERHLFGIVRRVAQKLQVNQDDIIDFDLHLYDTQPSTIGGINQDFIFASRIDNLGMTFCALQGLTSSLSSPNALDEDSTIRILAAYDNEEIGSKTALGGASTFLPTALRRLTNTDQTVGPETHDQALTRSFLISADMIHGFHPLYPGYHETNHRPLLNSGIVFSSGTRYSFVKNTPGTVLLSEIACWREDGGTPAKMQHFVSPNNSGCGATLGPILATKLGIRTVDVGNPMLSMHSIREVCGSEDISNGVLFMRGFWERFERVDRVVVVN